MNLKKKAILTAVLLVAFAALIAGCGETATPYNINDAENFTFSVKYDANGGTFTTNTSVIVDSYDLSQITAEKDGNKQIALLTPDDAARGNNAFTAVNNGYFLAGWYTERTVTQVNGEEVYQYSGKWDFETDRVSVDPKKTYTSAEPELTLYAAWIPYFEIEYYDLKTGELLSSTTFNPAQTDEIKLPQWNESTGKQDMHDVPKREGYTCSTVYLDAEGKNPVETATINHCAVVKAENATAENTTMKLYIDWAEGEWYHIYNVEQFQDNASLNGCYVIHNDLDFTGEIWPTVMMYGNFNGVIQGNGHVFRNIEITQTNNSKTYAGLFGQLSDNASISDLTFENVTFTIKSGTRVAGTAYGLLAGVIAENANISNLHILESNLQIDSDCYFGTDDYSIGLICGMGSAAIENAQINCVATGKNPERVIISVTEETVTVSFAD